MTAYMSAVYFVLRRQLPWRTQLSLVTTESLAIDQRKDGVEFGGDQITEPSTRMSTIRVPIVPSIDAITKALNRSCEGRR